MKRRRISKGRSRNIHDLSDAEFEEVAARLADSGIRINCFGSAIANWGKQIDEPFDSSLAEARRAIPRMQRLGTRLIRIMSFAVRAAEDQMDDERFRRLRTLQMMFTDAGLTPVHENCMNYGGMSWRHTLRMLEQVPGLKLVFDTGNPVFTGDYTQDPPRPMQSAWEFYRQVREFIAYVHIKDGHWDAATQQSVFTYPGEGVADVRRIVTDLLRTGYDAGFSMEPHLAVVHHDPTLTSPDAIRPGDRPSLPGPGNRPDRPAGVKGRRARPEVRPRVYRRRPRAPTSLPDRPIPSGPA